MVLNRFNDEKVYHKNTINEKYNHNNSFLFMR
jgi:hypothetical protein